MIRVAVDAMGGDNAPDEIVAGALEARSAEIEPILTGPPGLDTGGLDLIEAWQAIAMDEKPADAVREKPETSLVHIRRLPGVRRPAIAVVLPSRTRPSVLLDSGANADARPEHLLQFGQMGAIFAREVLDVERPEVRLLSIGEEPEKGSKLTLEAHELLAEAEELDFRGNIESRHLLEGGADVIVTDGFTGNVSLKLLEGTIKTVLDALRAEITASARGKLGGLLIRPAARGLRARLDPDTYGGAYLLGLRGLVVIAHGNSNRRAVANAIRLAAHGAEHDVVARLRERLQERVVASARFSAP